MGGFISKWYNEGIATTPVPCMYSKTCYYTLSKNSCCVAIGKWGTEWGERNRSQIMFVAFWLSFISLILLAAALACVSTDTVNITNVPFFTGIVTVDKLDGTKSDFSIYAGLNRVIINDCDLGAQCPPQSTAWDSVNCDQYFNNCNACADACLGSVTMVIMSFVTQIIQCTGDLGRSVAKYDLHCRKFRGIVTGIIGLISTLAALNAFADTCFRNLDSNLPNLSLSKTPGPAFVLLLVATILKVVDIWAHVIVPVPKEDYWIPGRKDVDCTAGADASGATGDDNL